MDDGVVGGGGGAAVEGKHAELDYHFFLNHIFLNGIFSQRQGFFLLHLLLIS